MTQTFSSSAARAQLGASSFATAATAKRGWDKYTEYNSLQSGRIWKVTKITFKSPEQIFYK
jgi:hypothetical protein